MRESRWRWYKRVGRHEVPSLSLPRTGRASGLIAALLSALSLVFVISPAAVAATSFGGFGTAAEEFNGVGGLGLDSATGDLYVSDLDNARAEKWTGAGTFLFAWGWHVNPSSPIEGFQTCTFETECQIGSEGSGSGEFSAPTAVAVDDNSSITDPSAGDVYVVDRNANRVQKFDPQGKFLFMFGGEVNKAKTEAVDAKLAKSETPTAADREAENVCSAGEECTVGTQGTANGQFDWNFESNGILAVGPGGRIYEGDKARVQVFEPNGAYRESISTGGLSTEGKITSLAVDAAGDVYLEDEGVPGVHEIEPGGLVAPVIWDELSESIEAIALDEAGDVFLVEDVNGARHIIEYGSGGQELDSFGSNMIGVNLPSFSGLHHGASGMAYSSALHELYVASVQESRVWVVPVPAPGPLIAEGSESAALGLHGTATAQATLNPEGNETTFHFEYVDQTHYQANGWANATSTPPISIASGFEESPVSVTLSKLAPSVYHYRIVAVNSQGTAIGADQTLDVALIEGPWAIGVANTSATLEARVNPMGTPTEYQLEYGTSTVHEHAVSGMVAEGSSYMAISTHRQDLEPSREYHYRLVISNEFGTRESEERTFITRAAVPGEFTLPDSRAWELVSPPDKKAALIQQEGTLRFEASADGNAIVYETNDTLGEQAVSKPPHTTVLSSHSATDWRSEDVSVPVVLPPEGTSVEPLGRSAWYLAFSPDLSAGLIEDELTEPEAPLSPEATERTPYIRHLLTCASNSESCFKPILTPNDVEPVGSKFGGTEKNAGTEAIGANPDLSHIVVKQYYGAPAGLYEWAENHLRPVSVLPDGTLVNTQDNLGVQGGGNGRIYAARAMSSDGRRIVWSNRANDSVGAGGRLQIELFVRDMTREKTLRVGGDGAIFQTMSADGARVFYLQKGDLHELNVETGSDSDLTPVHGSSEHNAGVSETILSPGEGETPASPHQLSYLYFIAKGVLASGGISGADNLYVLHQGEGGWSTTFIATLSSEDRHPGSESIYTSTAEYIYSNSRASADGRYLAFMSDKALTGYDNHDVASGQPDEEVYLYDAVAHRLVCVSCNPTGARPAGVFDNRRNLSVDRAGVWDGRGLAGFIPGWQQANIPSAFVEGVYQPRFLSDSGRMFFDSPDGLVSQATNGEMNVYEYEPVGVGSCSRASTTFSGAGNGCVSLLSPGTSAGESVFYDASENGNDAFFVTPSGLTPEDYDTAYDVYDAHVCATGWSCPATVAVSPPCTSGDSCKAAPSPQPTLYGAPPSATFNGNGNVAASSVTSKRRSLPNRCAKGRVRKKGHCVMRKPKKGRGSRRARRARAVKKAMRRGK